MSRYVTGNDLPVLLDLFQRLRRMKDCLAKLLAGDLTEEESREIHTWVQLFMDASDLGLAEEERFLKGVEAMDKAERPISDPFAMDTEAKNAAMRVFVDRIFQETEEAVDLGVAPEALWEAAFQLRNAAEHYTNTLYRHA